MLSQGKKQGKTVLTKNLLKIKRRIILASGSPRRQKLLKLLGLKFKVAKSNLNEEVLTKKLAGSKPKNLVKLLSLSKAISILDPNYKMAIKGDEIIAGFDTIVVCKNKIIGKPKNKTDALKKLLFLSNKQHKVLTGITILDLKKKLIVVDYDVTSVTMKKISNQEAKDYVKSREPLDKAGGYAIQGKGKKFIKSISGDYFNVVGLPINKFLLMLRSVI